MPFGPPPSILVEAGAPVKITAMAAAAALTGAELVPLVQNGLNVRSTASAIAALAVTTPAAPVNSIQFNNAGAFGGSANATFVSPLTTLHTLTVSTGDLTVTPGNITTGNTTSLDLETSGGLQVRIQHVASAVNYLRLQGGVAGNPAYPSIVPDGASTNVGVQYYTKGSGDHLFLTSFSALQQFKIAASSAQASVADLLEAAGGNANAFLTATGGNTNININIAPKGTGTVSFWKTTQLSGQPIFRVRNVAGTPASYLDAVASTGSPAELAATGTPAPCSLRLSATPNAGTGGFVELAAWTATNPGLRVYVTTPASAAAPNNYVAIQPSAGGNAVEIRVDGNGTNPGLTFKAGGTGNVIFDPASGTTLTVATATGTTLNLYNTVAATVNAFGAATVINIGAALGTVNFTQDIDVGNDATVGNNANIGNDLIAQNNVVALNEVEGSYLKISNGNQMITSTVAMTDNAAAQVGTLTNAPTAGNPTKWIGFNDNGTMRYIPAW